MSSFYKWRDWGTECLSRFSKITKLEGRRRTRLAGPKFMIPSPRLRCIKASYGIKLSGGHGPARGLATDPQCFSVVFCIPSPSCIGVEGTRNAMQSLPGSWLVKGPQLWIPVSSFISKWVLSTGGILLKTNFLYQTWVLSVLHFFFLIRVYFPKVPQKDMCFCMVKWFQ